MWSTHFNRFQYTRPSNWLLSIDCFQLKCNSISESSSSSTDWPYTILNTDTSSDPFLFSLMITHALKSVFENISCEWKRNLAKEIGALSFWFFVIHTFGIRHAHTANHRSERNWIKWCTECCVLFLLFFAFISRELLAFIRCMVKLTKRTVNKKKRRRAAEMRRRRLIARRLPNKRRSRILHHSVICCASGGKDRSLYWVRSYALLFPALVICHVVMYDVWIWIIIWDK